MTGLDILIGGVCCAGWLAVKTYEGLCNTRALIRHLIRARRRRREPRTIRIVGAPYEGPRESTAARKEPTTCPR